MVPKSVDNNEFVIRMTWYFKSERKGKVDTWAVNFDYSKNIYWCNCPVWMFNKHNRTCKHTDYVETFEPEPNTPETAIELTEEKKVVCKL